MNVSLVALLVVTVLMSGILSWTLRGVAWRRMLLDTPNQRSSHAHPTPRLGGVAIAGSSLTALVVARAWLGEDIGRAEWTLFLSGALIAAATGLMDDLLSLRPLTKFIGELCAVIPAIVVMAPALPPGPAWITIPLWIVLAAGYMNLFNFMDGSDGLAAGVAVITAIAFAIIASPSPWSSLTLALAAGALGFLWLNFPPASMFMGDAGSLFLGYGFAITGAMLVANGVSGVALGLTIAPFAADGGITLARRILHRERIFEGHRSHFYQRLLKTGWSHRDVAVLYWMWATVAGGAGVVYAGAPGWPQVASVLVSAIGVVCVILVVRDAERRMILSAQP